MSRNFLSVVALVLFGLSAFAQKKGYDPFAENEYCYQYTGGKKTYAVALNYGEDDVRIDSYVKKGKNWKNFGTASSFAFDLNEGDVVYSKGDTVSFVQLGGRNYILYSYLVKQPEDEGYNYHVCLYSVEDYSLNTLSFYGTPLKSKDGAFRIEGLSDYGLSDKGMEASYLESVLDATAFLQEIAQEDLLSDEYVKWWRDSNPAALTNAKSIEFGQISDDCSIAAAFDKAKKARRGSFEAAVVDVRGYTEVVVRNTKSNSSLLVWVEPQCVNRKTDRFLSSVYFENDNTLVLFYYKGKSTFKYRINLVARTVRR